MNTTAEWYASQARIAELESALSDCKQALSNSLATAVYASASSRIAAAFAEDKARQVLEKDKK